MDNITSIGNYMFTTCSALTSVADLSKVTSVGIQAFMNCSSLTTLEGLNFSALTSIGQQAFNNMKSFSLELGEHTFDSLEFLDIRAFANTAGITGKVVLPERITEIPENAFSSTGITGVDWSHITTIGVSAFRNCAGLTELHLPDSVTSIGESAFKGSGLTGELQLPNSVTSIGNEAFRNVKIEGNLVLPSALTFLGTRAFNETTISSVTFPGTLKNIGSYAFYRCSNLSGTLIIPEGVVSIGKAAFTQTGIEKAGACRQRTDHLGRCIQHLRQADFRADWANRARAKASCRPSAIGHLTTISISPTSISKHARQMLRSTRIRGRFLPVLL